MNIDLLEENQVVQNYQNILQLYNFIIRNKITEEEATRIGAYKASIIDHVLCNRQMLCAVKLEDHHISDHNNICKCK